MHAPSPSPPYQYFALIIRAIGVLEGIALVGNDEFGEKEGGVRVRSSHHQCP